ncbi:hypothetical protein D3C79_1032020 [compost metagenome]
MAGVFKIPITRDDNSLNIRLHLRQPPAQLQSVYLGHTDICKKKIRLLLHNELDGLFAILCQLNVIRMLAALLDHDRKSLSNHGLVVYD